MVLGLYIVLDNKCNYIPAIAHHPLYFDEGDECPLYLSETGDGESLRFFGVVFIFRA